MSTSASDSTTIWGRIAANPRPAGIWAAGLAVLVLLELGRFADGAMVVGGVFEILVGFTRGTIQAISGNFGNALIDPIGSLVYAILTVVVLAILAGPIRGYLPVSPTELYDPTLEKEDKLRGDRLVITAVLTVFVGLLALTPLGSAFDALVGAAISGLESISTLPTITSRELIPNQGHQVPGGGWEGTFLGLSPAISWAIRLVVIYAYAFGLLYWIWRGYITYREHYREADWSPIDDSINSLRAHPWGKFGLVIIIMFMVMAIWAPSVGPVTAEENLYEPYQHEVEYLNDNGEVETATHGAANIDARSNGGSNVGPMSYDNYGRWAPFGTNPDGKDLFTFLAYGARTSLVIGLIATGLSAGFALSLAMITAYYKGVIDLIAVVTSDVIQSVPAFLMILLLFIVAREANHPIISLYDGGILLALILAFVYWPGLWRSIRGPSLQISEAEWIDAAKSFGQRPSVTMRKHMAPYVFVYLLIYASLILGTIIITTAALSFLGVGINPPTPEWGRMISDGRSYVSTRSWHVATIPGVMIVFVTLGFNAFGDAIRDALDVQTDATNEGSGGAA